MITLPPKPMSFKGVEENVKIHDVVGVRRPDDGLGEPPEPKQFDVMSGAAIDGEVGQDPLQAGAAGDGHPVLRIQPERHETRGQLGDFVQGLLPGQGAPAAAGIGGPEGLAIGHRERHARVPELLLELGERGERVAVRYLKRQGYKIVYTRHRHRFGEVDIIASGPAEVLRQFEADLVAVVAGLITLVVTQISALLRSIVTEGKDEPAEKKEEPKDE